MGRNPFDPTGASQFSPVRLALSFNQARWVQRASVAQ